MSENGEICTAGKKFYTPAGTDGMDKFHLCFRSGPMKTKVDEDFSGLNKTLPTWQTFDH